MELNLEPVKVDLQIETPSLERGAFYSLCFITENDEAPRTLKVERLRDLLDNGYDRSSLAYNFCVGVFAQQGIPTVYVRAKRSVESYSYAFSADDNINYYFVVIESKELYEISKFNEYLIGEDEFKLQFYSNNSKDLFEAHNGKLVNYYQEVFDFSEEENYYLNKAYRVTTTHKYARHPYPVLIDDDAYTTVIEVLDASIKVLGLNLVESYQASMQVLDSELKVVIRDYAIEIGSDAYQASIEVLDSELKSTKRYFEHTILGDGYQPNIEVLDSQLKVVKRYITYIADDEYYTASITVLDSTLKII